MSNNLEECPRCHGTGEVEACYSDNGGWEYTMCRYCNGSGYIDKEFEEVFAKLTSTESSRAVEMLTTVTDEELNACYKPGGTEDEQ